MNYKDRDEWSDAALIAERSEIDAEIRRRAKIAQYESDQERLAQEVSDAVADDPPVIWGEVNSVMPGQHVIEDETEYINISGATLPTPPSAYPLGYRLANEPDHDEVDEWQPDEWVDVGELRKYQDVVYKVILAHNTQADWTPDVTPALWSVA